MIWDGVKNSRSGGGSVAISIAHHLVYTTLCNQTTTISMNSANALTLLGPVISRKEAISLSSPLHSPDLMSCDFFLWGVPKNKCLRSIHPELYKHSNNAFGTRLKQYPCQYAARGHAKLPDSTSRMHTFQWRTFGKRNV